jgi:hypothetical protein
VLDGRRFLICDRDRKWSTAVRARGVGVRVIRTPFCAPNCDAHASALFVPSNRNAWTGLFRWVSGTSAVRSPTSWSIIIYHRARNHQGFGNDLIDGVGVQPQNGRVRRRQRVGGLLSY